MDKELQSSCILFRESITKLVLHINGAAKECNLNQIHPFNAPSNSKMQMATIKTQNGINEN